MKVTERTVNQRLEIEEHIKNRQQDITGDTLLYRTIGFSLQGTYLFDFKNQVGSQFICKIKADFLSSFLSQMIMHETRVNENDSIPHRASFQHKLIIELFLCKVIVIYN